MPRQQLAPLSLEDLANVHQWTPNLRVNFERLTWNFREKGLTKREAERKAYEECRLIAVLKRKERKDQKASRKPKELE